MRKTLPTPGSCLGGFLSAAQIVPDPRSGALLGIPHAREMCSGTISSHLQASVSAKAGEHSVLASQD